MLRLRLRASHEKGRALAAANSPFVAEPDGTDRLAALGLPQAYWIQCAALCKQQDVVVAHAGKQIEVGHANELERLADAAMSRVRRDGVDI